MSPYIPVKIIADIHNFGYDDESGTFGEKLGAFSCPSMRVLLVHTHYQQPGGEDTVFAAERDALRRRGMDVHLFEGENKDLEAMNGLKKAITAFHNADACAAFRKKVLEVRPDVLHFHNTFPLFSPGIYREAKHLGLPTVKTLHNFRLFCANGLLFRDGRPCEDCLTRRSRLPALAHKCYRDSLATTAVCAGTMAWHEARHTWDTCIDRYIALTDFGRDKCIIAGLPATKVVVKPNFIPDPLSPQDPSPPRHGALFVGRLTHEKGLEPLLAAWAKTDGRLPLDIVGDGPLATMVAEKACQIPGIHWHGPRPRTEVLERMKKASMLVFPSLWYEGFPMTLVEAYACGLPVVASDLGSMSTIVRQGETGLKFPAGDSDALARIVTQTSPSAWEEMGRRARTEYEAHYTETKNMEQLLAIYQSAIAANQKR